MAMVSRYSLMIASNEQDPKDNTPWPDPLSKDFGSFNYTKPKQLFEPDDRFFHRPYLVTAIIYGGVPTGSAFTSKVYAQYDDIILNINNVPHISQIFSFANIVFPDQGDLTAFLKIDITTKAS